MPNKKSFILGVTGAIGSGKSFVGKILEGQGIPVIDTDHLAHELLNTPGPAYDQVIARFGKDIVTTPGGPIDRKKLGGYVFKYERARAELEAIMHPAIAKLQDERIAALSQHPIVAVLVPLLFEAGSEHKYDAIWCVTINREVQMARLELRDKASREQIMQRINAQWAQERKAELSDAVIDNSFTQQDTVSQVLKHLAGLRAQVGAAPVVAKSAPPAPAKVVTQNPPVVTQTPPIATTEADKPAASSADSTAKEEATDGASETDNAAANVRYRGILSNMAQVSSAEALDGLGNVATTAHKESDATMTMVVKSGANPANFTDGTGDVDSERELTVDVHMTVRNRPGKSGNGSGNGCSCGCDNCKSGCACMADCGCGCKPPAPKPTPVPTPVPTPDPTPGPQPDPNPEPQPCPKPAPVKDCAPGFRRCVGVLALISLLAFLGFLAYLAWHQTPVVINNPPVVVNQPVVVKPPVVVVVTPPPSTDSNACIGLSGETLSEPPAFSLPFLQNDVRWATAVWTVHYDNGQGYCRNSIVDGHDRLGRLTVRQFYGPHLAYRGQIAVKYLDDGSAQIDRYDSYNVYQARDSHRVIANEVR